MDRAAFEERGAWAAYNASQAGRPPRWLAERLVGLAGEGEGRLALDLGCGAGRDAAHLLDHGWRVLAIDGDETAGDLLRERLTPEQRSRLEVRTSDFADIVDLPPFDLVYAGWSLPFAGDDMPRLWSLLTEALAPGGWIACDLFGDRASSTADAGVAHVDETAARAMFAGLDVHDWVEEERDGASFTGPHHWHVFSAVARRPNGVRDQPDCRT